MGTGRDQGSVSDEEWERFLRDAEAGAGDAPKEPSARARMVTRRLREETGPPAPWRSHQPPRRRGRKAWYAVGVLAAAALLVVALAPQRVAGWVGLGDGEDGGDTSSAARSSGGAGQLPTLDEPFRGSPAVAWGNGTAGISMPSARATGWMDEKEVAQALDRTRDFLFDSSLDPGVLRGERPKAAIALINPHQEDVQDYLTTAFSAPSEENDPLMLFSRFRKDEVRPAGDVIKTQGRVTYEEGERGAVEVTTDVTYVYPLVRAEQGSDEVARTIVRREVVLSWDDPKKVITDPGTFSLVSYRMHSANGGCDTFTGYLTPEFGADLATTGPGAGPEVDPYDRDTSMTERTRDTDEACGRASRT
ncbi:hypothetical protein ACFV6E_09350 [Streptomyces sp. NPDC059785]|uniref:hypothetical protein n=1 Tax=Streptomyces sp. NPDC059785 TaxID=3346945 RepID=UPI0036612C12